MALIYHLQIVLTAKKIQAMKYDRNDYEVLSKWIFGLKIALVETTSVETVLLETEVR